MRKVSIVLILLILLNSCGTKIKEPQEFDNFAKRFDGYKANAEVTVYGNKSESKYRVVQYYSNPNKIRIETIEPDFIKGNVIIYNNNKKIIYNPLINNSLTVHQGEDEKFIYLGIITKEVFFNENNNCERRDEGEYIKVSSTIPDGNKYRRVAVLYMDKKFCYPKIMELLDEKGNMRMRIKYSDFEYNPAFDENLFKINE